jgi:cytochrome c biogenesis protein CcmG/thiol:disulfide interchange protein DsbE
VSTVDRESVADEDDGTDAGREPRLAVIVVAIVAVVVIGFVAVLATRDTAGEGGRRSHLVGELAPPIVGPTLDGGTFDLASQRGRWVIVNFFATWCTPCIVEHPELVDFQQRHAELGDAAVVSVVFDDDPDDARRFFEDRGGEWPVVVDEDRSVTVAYGVPQVPESFVVAPDGTIVQLFTGGITAARLDTLLAQYEVAAAEASP